MVLLTGTTVTRREKGQHPVGHELMTPGLRSSFCVVLAWRTPPTGCADPLLCTRLVCSNAMVHRLSSAQKISEALRIKPGAAGCEARTLSIVLCGPWLWRKPLCHYCRPLFSRQKEWVTSSTKRPSFTLMKFGPWWATTSAISSSTTSLAGSTRSTPHWHKTGSTKNNPRPDPWSSIA